MHLKRFTNWCICIVLLLSVVASSCQKDATDTEIARQQAVMKADSAIARSTPGNYLALSGTLSIKVQDSTYKFDAATDSIAFVSMSFGDDKYFGVTAINKDHTMSFGLSSKGMAATDVTRGIEGSQLILRPDAMHTQQYSLTRFTEAGDAGKIKLTDYRRDTVLTKGSFFTFLAKDDKEGSPFYRVEGTFDLKVKK